MSRFHNHTHIMTDCDALVAAVCAAPHDDLPRLVLADWLDEQGGDGRLWRELTYAHRRVSQTPPRRRPQPPDNWEAAIGRIPAEYRSWFAAGCSLRCGLWLPQNVAAEHSAALFRALAAKPFSADAKALDDSMRARARTAWLLAYAARSPADPAWLQANAAQSLVHAVRSRADDARTLDYAANAQMYAVRSRATAAQSRVYDDATRANAVWAHACRAELRWQAGWLAAVLDVLGATSISTGRKLKRP